MMHQRACQLRFVASRLLAGGLLLTSFFSLQHKAHAKDDLPPPADSKINFETDIQPIFETYCLDCHAESDPESNLRLDRRASLIRGGDSGEPAILTGKSAESHLIRLVAGADPNLSMPPGDRLSDEEVGLLRAWIDQGAVWPGPNGIVEKTELTTDHWAFQSLAAVEVPELDDPWIRNPIDAFVLRQLNQQGLQPNPQASVRALVRRMALDVWGLPPSPKQLEAFATDSSAEAIHGWIDSLLESPHYGERWARHWLDLVRFAETHGFETNRERPHAWRYRDYVISALNDDLPYDQFIREQLAGDSYGKPLALGYLVAGPYDLVKSPDINLTLMQRQNELDDMINTTGTAFLGLTLGCARCHNHKFDPVTQADYYSMQAIFAGVQHGDMSLPLSEKQQSELASIDQSITELRGQLAKYFRFPVSFDVNVESFDPTPARYVRFTVQGTTSAQPCIDELEVFAGSTNVALASLGAKAMASSSLPGYEIHKLEHINDGKFGNQHSWISNEVGGGWVQIELPEIKVVDQIKWGRDRKGQYQDRLATEYKIECSEDGQQWVTVATSLDRLPYNPAGIDTAIEQRLQQLSEEDRESAGGLFDELRQRQQRRRDLSESRIAYAGTYRQPGPTHRLYRGEPTAKREQVLPNVPGVFTDLDLAADAPEKLRRKALADWIASPDNPLTARVIVNRIWQFHFGKGLVGTPSDFGEAGVAPTHSELLDWLAGELIENGWSLKHIHRLILQSATYQQSSRPNEEALAIDGASRYLWRFPPRRLAAEPIRDSILSVTGVIDLHPGGPGFSAFEVEAENVRHYHPKKTYGPEDWRRMIYMTKVRMEQDSVFGLFDCPDAAVTVPARSRSTTPLQALNLFNSNFLMQQAELFAERLRGEAPEGLSHQVARAYELCYARLPDESESALAVDFASEFGLEAFCRAMLNSNEFLFLQ